MVRYYLEDTPMKHKDKQRIMRFRDNEFPEEYDFKANLWRINKDLSQIYFGGIECDPITEDEAKSIIQARNNQHT